MRILVVNDDGISSEGLVVAEEIAAQVAGGPENVWVVAPAFEQSGVAHCISYIRPMRLEPLGPRRVAIEGSPADCVLAGIHEIMKDGPPDLILSGVNRGHNVAEDTLYSGTVGGAMEGALQGCRSIALSQYFGPGNRSIADPYESARVHGADVVRAILKADIWEDHRYGVFYNVNFPPVPADGIAGVRATRQGHRPEATFGVQVQVAPNMRTYLWLTHGKGNESAAPGTDAYESMNGAITVTPLRADLTAQDLVATLGAAIDRTG
jgi:5'-nucleotidase